MKNLFLSILALVLLLALTFRARAEEPSLPDDLREVSIRANILSLSRDTKHLTARGKISLEVGHLQIDATSLELNIKSGITVLHSPLVHGYGKFSLKGSRLQLHHQTGLFNLTSPQLRLLSIHGPPIVIKGKRASCEKGTCHITEASGTSCPHDPHGFEIRADEVLVHPSGDIDLKKPTLLVEETKVAMLPWIRLRPPNTSGFLPPRLGWDKEGGAVFGPAGHIAIANGVFAEGHLAVRTSHGFESRSRLVSKNLDMTLDQLTSFPDTYARLRATAAAPLNSASLVTDLDIVTNRHIIDDLAIDPLNRAITHTVSRGLLIFKIKELVFETYVDVIESFNSQGQISPDVLTPRASIGLALPSRPVLNVLWPSLNFTFTRYGMANHDLYPDSVSATVPGHSRLEISPQLGLPGRLGPLSIDISIGTRHQLWLPDSAPQSKKAIHLAALGMNLGLPLYRKFKKFRHIIEPYVHYQLTPWFKGTTPPWVMDNYDLLYRGQALETGFTTRFDKLHAMQTFVLDIKERFDLPGFEADFGPSYLSATATIGPNWLRLSADSAWDHRENEPSVLGLSLLSHSNARNRIELGARWLGRGRGPHLTQPFSTAFGPWLTAVWPTWPKRQLEVFENFKMAITKRLTATTGARVGVWPNRLLHALYYGLELHSSCGCLKAGITASHRLATPVPDVMVTLGLAGI